jgi:hypothetical protein
MGMLRTTAGTGRGRTRTASAALVVTLLLGSSCGGGDEDVSEVVQGAEQDDDRSAEPGEGLDAEPDSEREELSSDDLDDASLTLDDMPAGWTTAPELLEDDEQETEGECAFDPDRGDGNELEVAFKEGETGPFVIQVIGEFDDDDDAEAFMDEFAEYAERCRSSEEDGVTTTFDPLSFPDIADESQSYRVSIDDPEAVPAELNVVLFRKGDRASVLALLSVFESPDAALTEELAMVAADRL